MQRTRYAALALLAALGLFPALVTGAAEANTHAKASDLIRSTVMVVIVDCDTTPAEKDEMLGVPQLKTCQILGNGSGTIIQADGTVLTNAHVPFAGDDPSSTKLYWTIVCLTVSSRQPPQPAYFAKAARYDRKLDLAILEPAYKLDGTPIKKGDIALPPLAIAKNTSNLEVEDDIRLLGYPGVGGTSVTVIDSKIAGFLGDQNVPQLGNSAWIKANPAAGPGVSGGTAVDDAGNLLGVPSAELGNSIRCVDANHDGKIDPATECIATTGSVQMVRPIEAYDLLMKEAPRPSATATSTPQTAPSLPFPGGQPTPTPGQPAPTQAAPAPTQPKSGPEPQAPGSNASILTGTLVSADTGDPIVGGYFIVVQPGIDYAKFKADQFKREDIFTLGVSDGSGRFQVLTPVERGQPYTVVVVAQGYATAYQDGLVVPAAAPNVVDLGKINMSAQS